MNTAMSAIAIYGGALLRYGQKEKMSTKRYNIDGGAVATRRNNIFAEFVTIKI